MIDKARLEELLASYDELHKELDEAIKWVQPRPAVGRLINNMTNINDCEKHSEPARSYMRIIYAMTRQQQT